MYSEAGKYNEVWSQLEQLLGRWFEDDNRLSDDTNISPSGVGRIHNIDNVLGYDPFEEKPEKNKENLEPVPV